MRLWQMVHVTLEKNNIGGASQREIAQKPNLSLPTSK
jgi:hypothetical protein